MQEYGGISAVLEQARLGIKLALRGKISPFPAQVKDPKQYFSLDSPLHILLIKC
jgi:heterodisulfide reductase subunit C